VKIDFEGIHDRIRRVSIADASEAGLFWSHDSKKLAFAATIDGKRGTYTISPPADLSPKLLSTVTGSQARWISQGNQIVWLSGDRPASLSSTGKATSYSFSANQEVDVAKKQEATFDACWREMRDTFYDGNLNNLNWDAIRRKYAPLARDAVDRSALSNVINMMLGELNGSHMGFMPTHERRGDDESWVEQTAHLGVRFDPQHSGPGLKIRDVIYKGPADKAASKLYAGEIVLQIDGVEVDPDMELTAILNGTLSRDIRLKVRNKENEERDVVLRPTSYREARDQLYEQWIRDNRDTVTRMSKDRFGYVHIEGMNMTSFYRFERELYSVGAGKDGLIIDVRENGGGSTTDHLLTILTQPVHAITVPRGGGPGYPQDRKVYASWNKPIVVLCNQNSFSNAEIFSHAI
jgi:tricorn protease